MALWPVAASRLVRDGELPFIRGPVSVLVSALAAPYGKALPSFMKHVAVPERSGLIRSSKLGRIRIRIRTCALKPKTLSLADGWLAEQRATWEGRIDRLATLAERLHQEETAT